MLLNYLIFLNLIYLNYLFINLLINKQKKITPTKYTIQCKPMLFYMSTTLYYYNVNIMAYHITLTISHHTILTHFIHTTYIIILI